MFRKYPKTFRIPVPQFNIGSKRVLSRKEIKELLNGYVTIEEKLDGANTGIIRHKGGFHLQKRGSLVGTSEHEQFQFFHNWANYQNYDKIMGLPKGFIVYGELMFAVHSLFYDRLPDYFIVFEVWNGKRYLSRDERAVFCQEHGFFQVPLIAEGYFTVDELGGMIPDKSAFGDKAEGFVVKRYRKKQKERLFGKVVKPEFIKNINESDHWTKYNIRRNQLEKG